jgi:hypothetical protein
VNQQFVLLRAKAGPVLDCNECGLSCSQLGLACGELRGQEGELRVKVNAQLLDRVFEPVVGGELLRLAFMDRFQVGEDDVGEELGHGSKGIIHEQILTATRVERFITGGRDFGNDMGVRQM